jgi:hypothetical protein
LVGNFGYIYCLTYFSSAIIAVVLYLEPLIGQYVATMLYDINSVPPLYSLAGGILVIVGMNIGKILEYLKFSV